MTKDKDKTIEPDPPIDESLMEKIQELIDSGFLTWNGQKLKPTKPVAKSKGNKTAAEIVSEMRR